CNYGKEINGCTPAIQSPGLGKTHYYRRLKSIIANALMPAAPRPYQDYKFKDFKKAFLRKLKFPWYQGTRHSCPVCGAGLKAFKPIFKSFPGKLKQYGFPYPLEAFETLNADAYSCPWCDASDRDRLYALYLGQRFAALDMDKTYKFVDFAPCLALSSKLRTCPFLDYRSADLYRKTADDRVDITDMGVYADDSIDVFLCSHILEHIPDDRRAMRELRRILKPGGFGIVMVPIITTMPETHEDPAITAPAQRWKHFCQDDHVRLYARGGANGLVTRLAQTGFKVRLLGLEYFGAQAFERHGIARNSVLYVVEK
ncbi:MAG: methyltransferase domain-containing protein, partial [Burkholderiales bacterium]